MTDDEGRVLKVPDMLAHPAAAGHGAVSRMRWCRWPRAAPSSVRLIEEAVQAGRLIGAVMQTRRRSRTRPTRDGLHDVGTLALDPQGAQAARRHLRLVVQGLGRFRVGELVQTSPFLRARIEADRGAGRDATDLEVEALGAQRDARSSRRSSRSRRRCPTSSPPWRGRRGPPGGSPT